MVGSRRGPRPSLIHHRRCPSEPQRPARPRTGSSRSVARVRARSSSRSVVRCARERSARRPGRGPRPALARRRRGGPRSRRPHRPPRRRPRLVGELDGGGGGARTTAPPSIRRGRCSGSGRSPPRRGRPRAAGARRSAANRAARPPPRAPRGSPPRCRVVALSEVVPAERAAPAPEEEGGPAVRLVHPPDGEHRIERDRPGDPESLRGSCDRIRALGEGETGRVDPDQGQAVPLVALVPRPQIGRERGRC